MTIGTSVSRLTVLDPTVEPAQAKAAMASRLSSLNGRVLGLLDNSKHNATEILNMMSILLGHRFMLGGSLPFRKRNASVIAPRELLDEIARKCQVALVAIGD
ncbi:MAG: hypothetical protein HYX82_00705 [Chloroflexi bacterium]|nr:hypothetical protein [Chloroflexota bacterium]